MDRISKEHRSWNMGRIKGKNTKPELIVRSFLYHHGIRYRLHDKKLPGKPDIVISKYKAIVEIRGCFWHRHSDCKFAYTPKSNSKFWEEKFISNVTRDNQNDGLLREMGWRVFVIWECEVIDESIIYEKILLPIKQQGEHHGARSSSTQEYERN